MKLKSCVFQNSHAFRKLPAPEPLNYVLYAYNYLIEQVRMKQEGKQKLCRKNQQKIPALIQKQHSKATFMFRLLGLKFPLCEVSIYNSGASSQVLFAAELSPSLFLD